jgi:alanyl aminopeptidase
VFADSLDAGFRAGNVSAVTYVYGLASLVNHESWDVVDAVAKYFEAATSIIESTKLAPVEKSFREILGPRFASLGATGDTGSRLLHQRMMRFLIIVAKEPKLRKPLADKAAAAIGLSSPADPTAAPVDQLETIFTVGVQDIGEPFFNLLLNQTVVSEDPAFRNSALRALARVEEPLLVKKLQAAIIDKKFKGTEMVGIVFRQMMRSATTEMTYNWIVREKETIVAMIPETFRSGIVPAFGTAFCSSDRAVEWDGFIKSIAQEIPGYERSLAQATESIRLCAALREESEDDLIEAMKNYE